MSDLESTAKKVASLIEDAKSPCVVVVICGDYNERPYVTAACSRRLPKMRHVFVVDDMPGLDDMPELGHFPEPCVVWNMPFDEHYSIQLISNACREPEGLRQSVVICLLDPGRLAPATKPLDMLRSLDVPVHVVNLYA